MAINDMMEMLRHDAQHHHHGAVRECAARAVVLGERDPRNAETALKMLTWATLEGVGLWARDALGLLKLETPARRVMVADNAQEEAVIGHLRGWCHDGNACAVCQADEGTRRAGSMLDSVIGG